MVVPGNQNSDNLQWCQGMRDRRPLMYRCVRRVLTIPHTLCDVERTFSVWKRVRSNNKQHSLKEGTHKAYLSFCFNGTTQRHTAK